jgi:nascent polypeptide-associated complex subunit alpha
MFPGMGGRGMNPKRLNAMMKQMGIEVEDIDDVEEVIVRTADREIVFKDATVSKMTAQGSTTWQISGTPQERPRGAPSAPETLVIAQEDIDLVAEQAKVSKEVARKALEAANGEPAEALLKLLGDDA